ncbi:MAG: putative DNA binding domain-containing protein, partial [Planctomycetota bacterium]|nr:putative DNA binding domain-containing protein [Planctomycetota bacterium]
MLPISLDDLIHARSIESTRLEFKKTWDEFTRLAVLETICAFANDFQNLNGGYVVLGIEESTESAGRPVLPPVGLDEQNLDEIQKQIRGECKKIDPEYQPVLEPVIFQDRQILVIWAPPGDARPYQAPAKRAPKDRKYFVRIGSSTVDAQGDLRNQLFGQTARIPFDDRRRMDVPISAISGELVRRFLTDVQSDLGSSGAWDETRDLLRALRLTARSNGDEYPKNVALLFFTEDPDSYFPGARIEVAQFGDGAGGDLIEEKDFRGPLDRQLRRVLEYLDSLSANLTRKVPGRAEAIRLVAFPYEALEESLANALLHRSYEGPPEPIKVYLYPDRMEITSYPGPVPGLTLQDLLPGARPNPVPMRNRRIGDFLKELRLAEMRGTGIPTIRRRMRENGSPEPQFVFDEQRTYFRVILPAHPEYIVLHGLREAGALWAVGEKERAIQNLDLARQQAPHAGSLAAQLIDYCSEQGDVARAERVFHEFIGRSEATAVELAYFAM